MLTSIAVSRHARSLVSARLLGVVGLLAALSAPGAEPIRVLVVGGQNNHNWQRSTPYLHYLLDREPDIAATLANAPPAQADETARAAWQPRFGDYACVVLDYNGQPWPEAQRQAFTDYVRGGGGVVVIHAANNAFPGWLDYETMVGLLWRGREYGASLYVADNGQVVREEPNQGRGMGHGGVYDWVMTTRDPDHPVTRGLPATWLHSHDELYHGQRGPAADLHILLTAFSDPAKGGTGKNEPILWWIPFGQGKVVTQLMGHVGDLTPLQCVGFQTLLVRACQWLATGACTKPVPATFPTAERTSLEELTPEAQELLAASAMARVTTPVRPATVAANDLQPGLQWQFFSGQWDRLPDVAALTPTRTGVATVIDLAPSPAKDGFGLVFSGFLRIDAAGDYSFFTASDDGSALWLGGVQVVANDGLHPVVEAGARVSLEAGIYAFELRYFEKSGGEGLTVLYAGPGIPKQPIPAALFGHTPPPATGAGR